MRTKSLLILFGAAAGLVGACGDNHVNTTPDATPKPACSDGIDNDGDGLIDYPDDPGCANANSDDEDGPVKPQCSDGRDNDGDGLVDFPMDPGCFAPVADSEDDDCPSGPSCPQCANGIDDDGNGSMDYPDDIGCSSASDPFEFTENPNACGANLMIKNLPPTGMDQGMLTTASTSDLVPSCGGVAGAPAIAYLMNLPEPKVMVAKTAGSMVDTVLMLRGANCSDGQSELACNDDVGTSNHTSSITTSLAAGNYYLIVSGATANATGDYVLEVKFFTGEGESCADTDECGPGLVCRTPVGETDMQCSQPQCKDGRDDDGDGKIDFPNDPGCESPDDNDEADDCPDGPDCPECSNGLDDDDDGLIDYPDDPNCTAASGKEEPCITTEGVIPLVMPTTTGTTVGKTNDFTPSCSSTSHSAADMMYELRVPALSSLSIVNTNDFDAVVLLFDATCEAPALACEDFPEDIIRTNVAAGAYYYMVDGWDSATGPYTITVSGTIENGESCESPLAQSGALTCATGYACQGTVGSRTCQVAACDDGMDNDGDGKTDYPNDPGCETPSDSDETDDCPGGPSCPACGNGIDDDNDGLIDYPADPGCTAASDVTELCAGEQDPLVTLTMANTGGNLTGASADLAISCGNTTAPGPNLVYLLEVPDMQSLTIDTQQSSVDTAVALLSAECTGPELGCNDDGFGFATPSLLTVSNLAAGQYAISVNAYGSSTTTGPFTLRVGGVIQNGASCEVPLAESGALTCGAGHACSGPMGSRTCQPAACNNGEDDDMDGNVDFPHDPGCESISDDDETDDCPSGPNCPECSNGIDDDGDSATDYPADTSCAAASSNSEACQATEGVIYLVDRVTPGTTVGATHDVVPSCNTSNSAPDVTYRLELPELTALELNLTASWDTVTVFYDSTCGGTPLKCSDPVDMNVGPVAAGTYYFVVDGWGTASGSYSINVNGTIAEGGSCEVPLALSDALTCEMGYACAGPMGSRTCQLAACNNGEDDDMDGQIDFPHDPGCDSISDDDETDDCPSGPSCAVCSNGLDDDTDGLVDYPDDTGCGSAAGVEFMCAQENDPHIPVTTPVYLGMMTSGHSNDFASSGCYFDTRGRDVVHTLQLPVPVASLHVQTIGPLDFILGIRDSVCGTEYVCSDASIEADEQVTLSNVQPGDYQIVVDTWTSSTTPDVGPYKLMVKGTVAAGTACDSPLFASGVLECPTGTTCGGSPMVCQ